MAIGSVGTETFASEVVMVEIPGTEKLAAEIEEKKEVDKDNEKTPKREEVEIPVRYDDRIRIRNYSRSRSPRRRALTPVISNTASLDSILNESDTCIETVKGQLLYITTHAFHTAELQKVSWLFQQGILDSWVQKPGAHLPTQFDLPRMDTRRGTQCPARICALHLEKDQDPQTSKVKFVTAVQGMNDARWVKLIVSHSRQAAAADICHEILNNSSIVFVGAVLKNVAVPAENPTKKARKLVRVASVQEAEDVEQGNIGVIC